MDKNDNTFTKENECENWSIKLLSKVFSIHIIHQFILMYSIKCRYPFIFYSMCIIYGNFLQDISQKIYSKKAMCET
jgi:hypothetical protein